MRATCRISVLLAFTFALAFTPSALAQPKLKGYDTKLILDTPITAGASQIVSGRGAPVGRGIWVELWKIPAGGKVPVSLASSPAFAGTYTFVEVSIAKGDYLFATLSRSWQFNIDGDLEGWGGSVNDAILTAKDGLLLVELENVSPDPPDAFTDCFFANFFEYDPKYYRVVEIRLRNPAPPAPTNALSLFWGTVKDTVNTLSQHAAVIPSDMDEFQTILFPMNVAELDIVPGDPAPYTVKDGLWDLGSPNLYLRIDPLDNIPPDDRSLDGTVFEIDSIRIREDYRFEFHLDGDVQGYRIRNDIDEFTAKDGFLTYLAADVGLNVDPNAAPDGGVDPYILSGLLTGRLDTIYFTRFAMGLDGVSIGADSLACGIFFDDADSTGYLDDGGAGGLQQVDFAFNVVGRTDVAYVMDDLQTSGGSAGEWSEDGGKVPDDGLRLDCPQNAIAGDKIGIDYLGWIPAEPFGPSEAVEVEAESEVRLTLDSPILTGAGQTITGSGAPEGEGIWVELWKRSGPTAVPESVASAQAIAGTFVFDNVSVADGDVLYVTLSRSWHFNTDGDAEGWNGEVSPDAILEVLEGTLRVTIQDGNGDTFRDPYFVNSFPYDPKYYRVVEVRLKNPLALTPSFLGIFWGSPWPDRISQHDGVIPENMDDFMTILFPMNVDEIAITPDFATGQDGRWDQGVLNTSLRLDPPNNLPADGTFDLLTIEIDYIRIRQDYRFDFDTDDDIMGWRISNDVTSLDTAGGYLTYQTSDVGVNVDPNAAPDGFVDPHILSGLYTGRLDTSYFRRFVLATDNASVAFDPLTFGIFFDDNDSTGYWDDCLPPDCTPGTTALQEVNFQLPALGHQVRDFLMANFSLGEWVEDGGRVPTSSLRFDCPQGGNEGDRIRIDYIGWTALRPVPPSEPVAVTSGRPQFRRGDADAKGGVPNITDGIYVLNYLFLGGPAPSCLEAADADNKGGINITDGIYILNYLFQGGAAPPSPGPDACGPDPDAPGSPGDTGCEVYDKC